MRNRDQDQVQAQGEGVHLRSLRGAQPLDRGPRCLRRRPTGSRTNGLYYCLVCRRERAIDAAIERAGDVSTADRAKLRSSAVVDFELDRDPDRTEGEIAKAARASIGAVRKARKRRPV